MAMNEEERKRIAEFKEKYNLSNPIMPDDGADGGSGGTYPADLNVVPLKQPPNEIEAAGESLRRNEAAMVENAKIVARLRRASYLAYREAGFTAEEALTLCTK
jgi:hypothetical protein